MKKYYLGSLLILLSTCLWACHSNENDTLSLSVSDFEKGIAKENVQILDVRTMQEYQSGHIKNALLADWTNTDEFISRTESLDKSKAVYAYCFSGARSFKAAMFLKEKGYTVYHLDGGIAAWKRENRSVEGNNNIKQISLQEYQSLIPADKTVLVDIGASWCPPCKKMEPTIESLQKSNGAIFSLVKIDGGEQETLVKALGISAFPTFIIYKQGKEYWRKNGIVSEEELMEHLK